jgi:hypothetical protein
MYNPSYRITLGLICVGVAVACILSLSSCKAVDSLLSTPVPVIDRETGEEVGETTIDAIVVESGAIDTSSHIIGAVTGNPLLGAAAAAVASALLVGSRRRRSATISS